MPPPHPLPPALTLALALAQPPHQVPEGASPSYDCAWKLQPANVDLRLGVQGQPVKTTDEVVVVHAFTNKRLAVTTTAVQGDMGMEAAVCCHTYSEPRKVNKMQRENHGFPNHNFGTRCETNENVFALTYAAAEAAA